MRHWGMAREAPIGSTIDGQDIWCEVDRFDLVQRIDQQVRSAKGRLRTAEEEIQRLRPRVRQAEQRAAHEAAATAAVAAVPIIEQLIPLLDQVATLDAQLVPLRARAPQIPVPIEPMGRRVSDWLAHARRFVTKVRP